jgi:hypothetical protein
LKSRSAPAALRIAGRGACTSPVIPLKLDLGPLF